MERKGWLNNVDNGLWGRYFDLQIALRKHYIDLESWLRLEENNVS